MFVLLGLISAGAVAAEKSPSAEAAKPAEPSSAALKLLEFSPPVNGLVARIEGIRSSYYRSNYLALRLENRGQTPLEVPSPCPADPKQPSPYSLWGRDFGKWKRVPWPKDEDSAYGRPSSVGPPSASVVLQPGEGVLFLLGGRLMGRWGDAGPIDDLAELTVVVYREKAAAKNAWTGKLQTPPYPIHTGGSLLHEVGQAADDAHVLSAVQPRAGGIHERPSRRRGGLHGTPQFQLALVTQLHRYPPADVAHLLEKRVAEEKNAALRKFLTVYMYAAAAGDFEEKPFVTGRGIFAEASDDLLEILGRQRQLDGPKWQPTRKWVTDALLEAFQKSPTSKELASVLGELKCKEGVPLLVKMLRIPMRRDCAAEALGKIGDPRAVPALLEALPAAVAETDKRDSRYTWNRSAVLDARWNSRRRRPCPPSSS